jgi:PBSX family phage terminase large subunit
MVVLRKVGNTLRNSVFAQVQWALDELQIANKFKIITSPPEMTYKKTGQKILFMGVDDKSKIKSIKLPFGYVGIVWYEELDQFAGMHEIRNVNQSLLRGGSEYWCFYSFNPPKSRDNWVNVEQLTDDTDRLVDHSTYLQVPAAWLGDQFILEAEKLKKKNETFYDHEYLGMVTGTGGSVFDNVEDMQMDDDMIGKFDHLYYGLDFGFSVDPLAFVAMQYDAKHEIMYIFDEIYQQKILTKTASDRIKNKIHQCIIYADSADPRAIAEMSSYGLTIYGTKKGPDSINHGVKWLQERAHIYIDKRRCPNTYKEFISYEYEMNKDGQYISAYPDKNNHAIDATRYAMESVMRKTKIVAKHIDF